MLGIVLQYTHLLGNSLQHTKMLDNILQYTHGLGDILKHTHLLRYILQDTYMAAGAYKCPGNEELLPLKLMSSPLRNLDPRALLACFVLGLFFKISPREPESAYKIFLSKKTCFSIETVVKTGGNRVLFMGTRYKPKMTKNVTSTYV